MHALKNVRDNVRDLFLAAAAGAAAVAVAVPAHAAVIQVASNAERSPEYAVPDGGTARIVGTITGTYSGSRYTNTAGTARLVNFAMNPLYRADPEREWPMVGTGAYWADQ